MTLHNHTTLEHDQMQKSESISYKIVLRNFTIEDYEDMKEAMTEAYMGMAGQSWTKNQIRKLLSKFPEGQLCVVVNGKVVGCAFSMIVDYKRFGDNHTYLQIVDEYKFGTHDSEKGDTLYGIDVFIHPEYRGLRLGRRLYDARKELCENLSLKSIIAGGRIPNYSKYADEFSPKQYIEKVKLKEIFDPILTFQLSNDFHVKKILQNYLPEDDDSRSFATLIEWNNLYYVENEKLINAKPSVVRLGLVQWLMRSVHSLDALAEQIEFYVDVLSDYEADFILFPELFNAPLMAKYNDMPESEAIRMLARYTEPLYKRFADLAVTYNVNIITGSMPYMENGKLYNISYLCRRDGTSEAHRKIHITPAESHYWGMIGGDQIKVFDTDCGKIGILICYDAEFPELSRLYAEQGVDILFVPFLTDTQNGYNRVRLCAQARAVENECYVAIAGCVGNLPKVQNMDIQYAQSAVFSPSDFAFPTNSTVAEATPNTEMTIIADVNLDLLKELRSHGSVTNMLDRRTDLYSVTLLPKKENTEN